CAERRRSGLVARPTGRDSGPAVATLNGRQTVFAEKRLARFAEQLMTTAPVPMRLQLWNGLAYDLGPAPAVTVKVKEPAAIKALVTADFSDLGEAYIREQIDVEGP